ncbi:putative selenium-dependent hydroxylase accessory protein YqeC [bacterium]|nr:putative selenium-dependent hydroxylase accessory protein YqeC [bacterium]
MPSPIIAAIIGSGGKTTLMNRLAQSSPGRVLMTTTTHLAYPAAVPASAAGFHALKPGNASAHGQIYPGRFVPFSSCAALAQYWNEHPEEKVILSARLDCEGRQLLSLSPNEADELSALPGLSRLLAEADGSKHLPIKAHRDNEPVLFSSCNLGIAVIGLTAIGRQVCEGQVHRPELLQKLLQCSAEHRLTPQDLAKAMLAYLEKFSCPRRIAVLSQGEHCPEEYTKETEKALLRLLRDYPQDWARQVLVTTAAEFPLALEKLPS